MRGLDKDRDRERERVSTGKDGRTEGKKEQREAGERKRAVSQASATRTTIWKFARIKQRKVK